MHFSVGCHGNHHRSSIDHLHNRHLHRLPVSSTVSKSRIAIQGVKAAQCGGTKLQAQQT